MLARVVRVHAFGGPEALDFEAVELPPPETGCVQVRHTAIGLNYIDTYFRSGLYPNPLPTGLGLEAAGVVTMVGLGVHDFQTGDRIAYGSGPIGAYCDYRNIPASRVQKIPDTISDRVAAGMMTKGMTARFLLRECYVVKAGDFIVFQAAAGGVGMIACQWAKMLGARVIGTVGSDEKAALAREFGCDHVINYRTEDVPARVRDITDGARVPVVYDGIGRDTFETSLNCLRDRGLLVSFGSASGPVKGVDLSLLAERSLYVTRPTLPTYISTDEKLRANAEETIAVVASGKIRIPVQQVFPLSEVRKAHEMLQSRATTGVTVLVP
jgi:NADPH2:quinone reductase